MYLRQGDVSLNVSDATASAPMSGGTLSRNDLTARSSNLQPTVPSALPAINLHGIRVNRITETQCIAHIIGQSKAGYGGVVVTPNLDHIRRCKQDLTFGALLAEAEIVVADGMPLVWASKLQGTPLPERVAGSNLISTLSAAAAQNQRSIFMLGGTPGAAEAAAAVLMQRHPDLKIAGMYCPPVGFETDPAAMANLQDALTSASPDIVYVALGSPKQELLINQIRKLLPKAWWLGVGISFSFLAGEVRRAPRWMQLAGLEWMHRLIQEPRRLFYRYIVKGIPFGVALLGKAALRGLPRRFGRGSDLELEAIAQVAELNGNTGLTPATSNGNSRAGSYETQANSSRFTGDRRSNRRRNGTSNGSNKLSAAASSLVATQSLKPLRAIILLGGTVRPTPLTTSINRSVLDLPLDDRGSILNHWLIQAAEIARLTGQESLPVRLMVDRNSPEPQTASAEYKSNLLVERDLSQYRGTGGVLHDISKDYQEDDLILVANAAQILLEPLHEIVVTLQSRGGQVSLVSHEDGTPSGIMLVNCKTLRLIPSTGFVDMKEQALPTIASKFDVSVEERVRPTGLPVRTLSDYLTALRVYHRLRGGKPLVSDPLAEDWQPSFARIEAGATVDPTARLHDSVVLKGAIVEPGAVLVRSIVCAGGLVRRDRQVVDQYVTAGENRRGAVEN
jgi:N-acetylglucosaminyldiphosphoundecaprenol N-acetyl-beta-D-mannosaminyltransferase